YYATVGSATCGAKDSVYFDLAIVDINEPDTVYICLGDEITLHGSIDGLAENFIWSPTDSLSNPNILNPVANPIVTTTYLLQSNIGVCTAFDRVVVRVDSIPKDLHINIAPQKDHYCQGEIVALFSASFDTLDFPDLVFDWSPYNQTFTSPKDVLNAALTLNDTTLYIRDNINNACMTKDSILIKVVPSGVPISVSDTTLCPGEKFNVRILSDQVHDPEWTPEDGLSCTKCLNPTVTVTGLPGSTVSYMFSGKILECPVGANLTIHIPGIQIINLAADQTVCTGDTTSVLILNPEGLSDFNWSVTNGDASLSCTSCIKPVVTVNSNNAITIVVNAMTSDHTQSCGAVGSINLNPGLEFHDNRPQIQACLGGTVVATTGNSNYTNIQWDVTGGQLSLSCSNCPTPTVTVNSNGMLRFFAESPDPDICKVIGSVPVGIFPEDESNLLITPDPNAGAGIGQGADVMATLSASPPPASVMWNINGVNLPTTTSTVTFNASNEINFVTATFINSKGCEQIDTLSFHTT
ncbi:MAG: hypothetical protein ABIQ02_12635, partial [Saprospiraceae bacterium]